LPALRQRRVYAEFDAVAQLSATLATLKSQHDVLSEQLTDAITGGNQTRFTRFERRERDFAARLVRRESELSALAKFMNRYRSSPRPTFVEVDASPALKSAKRSYELIKASLLVSNEQQPFFTQPDLERQNAELRALIDEQESVLRLVRAQLKLFRSFQNAKAVEFTLHSLRRGRAPTSAAADAPTIATELRTKLRVLSAELRQLVSERSELTRRRIAQKIAARPRAAGGRASPTEA
jgi:hypothetical protein